MTETLNTNHGIVRHATALPDQWLYLLGEGGVIYSERTNRFAGLDAGGVSAYLAFQAGASPKELRRGGGENRNGELEAIHFAGSRDLPH